MTAIDLTNSNTATVDGRTYTYNSTTSRWEITTGNSPGLTTEQVQDVIAAQLVTNGSHTGISFAYDDSGDGAIDATIGTLNQNTTGTAATLTTPRSIGGPSFDGSADINLPGVNTTGNQNTSGTAATLTTPREINGVAFNGSADITIQGGDPTIYATMALLVAATGMSAGDMAFVSANNNLYLYTGSGWFKVATVENNSPSAITGVAAATTLADDGTATVITAVSTDPEGFPLTWSYAVTTGSLTNGGGATATVSQADNVFTITPTTTEAYAGTFSITFSATDGVNGAVTAASAFTLVFTVDWSSISQQQKIIGGGATAVAIDGNTAAFSDWSNSQVKIYTRSGTTWSLEDTVTVTGGNSQYIGDNDNIRISGDTIVAGASRYDTSNPYSSNEGCAYVFTRSGTTWSQQAQLTASDAGPSDYFGTSVDIDGDSIIVGAPEWDQGSNYNVGSVYIFTRSGTTWSQQQRINPTSQYGDQAGSGVGISGDTIVIGGDEAGASQYANTGRAWVYVRSGTSWSFQSTLIPSDVSTTPNNATKFGKSVAIDEDTIVVGAWENDTVYVFTRSGTTWTEEQKIKPGYGSGEDFGWSVAIDGDDIIIGVREYDTSGFVHDGGANIYQRSGTTWSSESFLTSSDKQNSGKFGYSVAISGSTVIVAAPGEGDSYIWAA
jgi:hypothetical protein